MKKLPSPSRWITASGWPSAASSVRRSSWLTSPWNSIVIEEPPVNSRPAFSPLGSSSDTALTTITTKEMAKNQLRFPTKSIVLP